MANYYIKRENDRSQILPNNKVAEREDEGCNVTIIKQKGSDRLEPGLDQPPGGDSDQPKMSLDQPPKGGSDRPIMSLDQPSREGNDRPMTSLDQSSKEDGDRLKPNSQ